MLLWLLDDIFKVHFHDLLRHQLLQLILRARFEPVLDVPYLLLGAVSLRNILTIDLIDLIYILNRVLLVILLHHHLILLLFMFELIDLVYDIVNC